LSTLDVFVILGGLIVRNILEFVYMVLWDTSKAHRMHLLADSAVSVQQSWGETLLLYQVILMLYCLLLLHLQDSVLGFINMLITTWIVRNIKPRKVDKVFRRLQLISAGFYSFGTVSNDAQKLREL
jgi:PiT family inorganic phosphate transporter